MGAHMISKPQWFAFLRHRGIERNATRQAEYEVAKALIKRKATTPEEYEQLILWTTEYLGY